MQLVTIASLKKARQVGPSPYFVAALARELREALTQDLAPDSWAEVARALRYGNMQVVEDLVLGDPQAMADRILAVARGAYERVSNAELARIKSGVRFQVVKAPMGLTFDRPRGAQRNRFVDVPHSNAFIKEKAAALVVKVSHDQRQSIREALLARYNVERRPEMLVRDLKQVVGLDPRRAKALRNFEDKLREGGAKNVPAQVERYRGDLLQNRAETIARTEGNAIETKAKQEAWEVAVDEGALPLDAEQEWVATPDACPTCQELDGERVGIGELFPGGLSGPPAHPSCYCGVVVRSF